MKPLKRIFAILAPLFAVIIGCLLMFTSCEEIKNSKTKRIVQTSYKLYGKYPEEMYRFICTITVDTIKGHEYIIAEESGGLCIIHAESCECRKRYHATEQEETSNDFDW